MTRFTQPTKQSFGIRLCALILMTVWVLFAATPVLGQTAAIPTEEIRIGVLAKRGSERCLEKWTPTAEYLTAKIPGYVFSIMPLSYDEFGQTVGRGEVDFILTNPACYVQIEHDYGARRIATLVNLRLGRGFTEYAGVLFTRTDSENIKQIPDLVGKTFMAVSENSFGGWHMIWRKLKEEGFDPYSDFADLRFGGMHDAVVYAVRDGEVDAGCVRIDTLERMAMEGKIRLEDFRVIAPHRQSHDIPFMHSTRHYPEWPVAKLSHTPEELAKKVAVALLTMPADCLAARAARCAGWTLPHNFWMVRECLRAIQVTPYEDYGKVTLSQTLRQHWISALAVFVLVLVSVAFGVYAVRSRRRIINSTQSLRKSEERFQQVTESAEEWVWEVDPTALYTYASPVVEKVLGYKPEELVGKKHPYDLFFSNDIEPLKKATLELFAERKPLHEFLNKNVHKNGGIVLFSTNGVPFYDADGCFAGYRGADTNITRRKQAEEALSESEEKFRTLYESTNDAFMLLDENGFFDCNESTLQLFGFNTREEFYRTNPGELSPPTQPNGQNSTDYANCNIAIALKKGHYRIEHLHRRTDGTEFPADVLLNSVEIGGRRVLHAVVRDITKHKQAEERLAHLNAVLRAIRNVNQLIIREKNRDRLLQATCDCLIETRGYFGVWIAMLNETGKFTASAEAGLGKAFAPMRDTLGRGELPSCVRGTLSKQGIVVVNNPPVECSDCPLSKNYCGRSCMGIRLEHNGKPYGLLCASISPQYADSQEEAELLEEVAGDIAFALYGMEIEEERKRAEETLLKERNFAESLVNTAQAIILVLDVKGKIVSFNLYMEEITGYSLDEVRGKDWFANFLPEENRLKIRRLFLKAIGDIHTKGNVNTIITKGGSRRDIEWYDKTLKDIDGNVTGLLAIGQDVTERKLAENALCSSKEKQERLYSMLRLMCDNMPALIWSKDIENKFLFANKTCCTNLLNARDTNEPIGKNDLFFAEREKQSHSDNPDYHTFGEICAGSDMAVLESRKTMRTEESGNIKGKFVVLDVFKAPLLDKQSKLIGTVGYARDITKEKEMEAENKQAEDQILSQARFPNENPNPVLRITSDGKVLYANEAGELLLKNAKDTQHHNVPEDWVKLAAEAMKSKQLRRVERKYEKQTFSLTFAPIADAGYVNIYAREITERKQLEKELRQSEKMTMVGQLAAGVAHDFRNQLTVVKGYGEMLADASPKESEPRQYAEIILAAVEKATMVTSQLLAFGRKESLHPEIVDLNEPISDLARSLPKMVGEDIVISITLSPKQCYSWIDTGLLQQTIMNLAINARHAMPDGGELTITTNCANLSKNDLLNHSGFAPGQYCVISVSDTGIGMDSKTIARIFEPFFTTKEVGKGTGMGLAMVHGFVLQSGGFIKVRSKPDQGTIFNLHFPTVDYTEVDKTKKPAKIPDTIPTGTETLLVVEDEEMVRHLLVTMLRDCGYTVLEAANATEALPLGEHYEGEIALLVTDVIMPKMNGMELAGRLRKVRPNMPVLFISGYAKDTVPKKELLEPWSELLDKPIDRTVLAKTVRQLIDRQPTIVEGQ